MTKPVVYIASPYTKGDPGINTHFQCRIFDQLMDDSKVWPVAPLWSHFQHINYPRQYQDWIDYDMAMIPRYDACLRLSAYYDKTDYSATESDGADAEVVLFKSLNKPVFYCVAELYAWVDEQLETPLAAHLAYQDGFAELRELARSGEMPLGENHGSTYEYLDDDDEEEEEEERD
jgi:hypothetical protein